MRRGDTVERVARVGKPSRGQIEDAQLEVVRKGRPFLRARLLERLDGERRLLRLHRELAQPDEVRRGRCS